MLDHAPLPLFITKKHNMYNEIYARR